jgi:hypothetical protein
MSAAVAMRLTHCERLSLGQRAGDQRGDMITKAYVAVAVVLRSVGGQETRTGRPTHGNAAERAVGERF